MKETSKNRKRRMKGTIQKVSKNPYGWNATPRGVVVPTVDGDIDVSVPRNRWIGDDGNLIYTVSLSLDGDLEVFSNEDYTHGNFPNAHRTDPDQVIVFSASQTAPGIWEITKNDLPDGYVKPSSEDDFGRYYWDI